MASDPIAETSYGKLRGTLENGIRVYRGVPFAKPPIGPLRFRPPQRAQAWGGVRDATRFGAGSYQADRPLAPVLGIVVPEQSEDCLTLNVWTPADRDGGRRPVMVWFHGGAWVIGAGSETAYDGAALARRGDARHRHRQLQARSVRLPARQGAGTRQHRQRGVARPDRRPRMGARRGRGVRRRSRQRHRVRQFRGLGQHRLHADDAARARPLSQGDPAKRRAQSAAPAARRARDHAPDAAADRHRARARKRASRRAGERAGLGHECDLRALGASSLLARGGRRGDSREAVWRARRRLRARRAADRGNESRGDEALSVPRSDDRRAGPERSRRSLLAGVPGE